MDYLGIIFLRRSYFIYTDTSYCIRILWAVCHSIFFFLGGGGATLYMNQEPLLRYFFAVNVHVQLTIDSKILLDSWTNMHTSCRGHIHLKPSRLKTFCKIEWDVAVTAFTGFAWLLNGSYVVLTGRLLCAPCNSVVDPIITTKTP